MFGQVEDLERTRDPRFITSQPLGQFRFQIAVLFNQPLIAFRFLIAGQVFSQEIVYEGLGCCNI